MSTIQELWSEGRICRGEWSKTDENGREMLCLFTALAGDKNARPETCNASLCQQWVAYLLPCIDDNGTEERWSGFVDRVVVMAPRLHLLGKRAEYRTEIVILEFAREYAMKDARTLAAIDGVLGILRRASGGDVVADGEWRLAESAAAAAAAAAAAVAAGAARAAARAAGAESAYDTIIDRILTVWEQELA